jgi:hypothetical protein
LKRKKNVKSLDKKIVHSSEPSAEEAAKEFLFNLLQITTVRGNGMEHNARV